MNLADKRNATENSTTHKLRKPVGNSAPMTRIANQCRQIDLPSRVLNARLLLEFQVGAKAW
jgi:hypothetical protein